MLRHSLKIALRSFRRNKSYLVINGLGLALGIACSLLIFLVVKYELSFDNFHPQADQIFRVTTHKLEDSDEETYNPGTPYPLASALRNDFPEMKIVTTTNYNPNKKGLIKAADKLFEENIALVEPAFFQLFRFEWLAGNPANALAAPRTVVLTKQQAQKYFNLTETNVAAALGKIIRLNNQVDLKVTGILADFPTNTDFPFSVLVSYATKKDYLTTDQLQSWSMISTEAYTFVQLPRQESPQPYAAKLKRLGAKYLGEEAARKTYFTLQPLANMHFDTRYNNYSDRVVDKNILWALTLVAVFLIVSSCVNYINLVTAQAIKRAKEVGVRKVLGSTRAHLIGQFMGETALLTFFAVLVAVALVPMVLPSLKILLNIPLVFNILKDPATLLFLVSVFLTISFLASIYPAIILSGFSPNQALKAKVNSGQSGGLFLRKSLVVLQCSISQLLIIGTIVIVSQMHYFRNKPLGFQKEAIITVKLPEADSLKLQTLRHQLIAHPAVEKVSFAVSAPSTPTNNMKSRFTYKNQGEVLKHPMELKFVDGEYIDLYGLKLLAGRKLTDKEVTSAYVVNETLIRQMGLTDPQAAIGKIIEMPGIPAPIVGVVQDFHVRKLNEEIKPTMLAVLPSVYKEAGIKINLVNRKAALAHIEQVWRKTYPEHLFSYSFLDETIAGFYEKEERILQLFQVFTCVAIFIGCLGLYGLISFITVQRTKEMGIRKVLGASAVSIVALFSQEFIKLVLLANLVAWPLAWWALQSWLQDFHYRIELSWWIFAVAGLSALIMAVLSISLQSVKIAIANPVKALRSE